MEKSIAERLRHSSSREERQRLYSTMYDELFNRVPDHPRLIQRQDEELSRKANAAKMALVREFIDPYTVFVEFAPGDCRFALDMTRHVRKVYGVDISDQRGTDRLFPENFRLIVYDGYRLDEIADASVDFVFSDQFVEHLHPEDVRLHFELVRRILKPGGKYLLVTPHAYNGPHDVSRYFSQQAQGFHLREWTFGELLPLLEGVGFSAVAPMWWARGIRLDLPARYFLRCEEGLGRLAWQYRRVLARGYVFTPPPLTRA